MSNMVFHTRPCQSFKRCSSSGQHSEPRRLIIRVREQMQRAEGL